MNFGGVRGGCSWSTLYHTFFVYYLKKTEKVQEHDLYLNQLIHHFDLKKNSKDE